MKHQAFRMEFTPRELQYFLFRKKICPKCGGQMDKSREYETRYGYEFPSRRDPYPADNARVKFYTYYFTCRECGTKYPLRDLVQ